MAASLDAQANDSLAVLLAARTELETVSAAHTRAYLRYIRDCKDAGWSWRRIAAAMGVEPAGVRRYWSAHRQQVGRLGHA